MYMRNKVRRRTLSGMGVWANLVTERREWTSNYHLLSALSPAPLRVLPWLNGGALFGVF